MDDRELTVREQKRRVLRFWEDVNYILPATGAKDEPLQSICFNEDWSPIVLGWLGWLASVAAWRDAESEDYAGILGILDILSIECPEPTGVIMDIRINGCDLEALIDGQWVNKGSLLPCITSITNPMQTQINTNTNDINAHQNLINSLTDYVADHETRIGSIEGDIVDIQLSILGLNVITDDHEARLSALEILVANLPASGQGGTDIKITPYRALCSSLDSTTGITWLISNQSLIQHEFVFDNAFIMIEFRGKSTQSGGAEYRPYVQNQEKSLAYNQCGVETSLQIQDLYTGLAGQTLDVGIEYHSSGGAAQIVAGQTIQYFIFEWKGIVSNIITFDAGTLPYTLVSPNVGIISTGGNPDNCILAQSVAPGGQMILETDFGFDVTMNGIDLQLFSSNFLKLTWELLVDGQSIVAHGNVNQTNNAWIQTMFTDTVFPIVGQVFQIRIGNSDTVSMADMRCDNIDFDWQA